MTTGESNRCIAQATDLLHPSMHLSYEIRGAFAFEIALHMKPTPVACAAETVSEALSEGNSMSTPVMPTCGGNRSKIRGAIDSLIAGLFGLRDICNKC